jgi:hypothetical protein
VDLIRQINELELHDLPLSRIVLLPEASLPVVVIVACFYNESRKEYEERSLIFENVSQLKVDS